MIALAIGALALAAAALAAVVFFGTKSLGLSSTLGDERERRVIAEAGVAAANREVANMRAAYERQRERGDVLEEEIDAIEQSPISLADNERRAGRQRLRESLRLQALLGAGDDGGDDSDAVPQEGPATTPS